MQTRTTINLSTRCHKIIVQQDEKQLGVKRVSVLHQWNEICYKSRCRKMSWNSWIYILSRSVWQPEPWYTKAVANHALCPVWIHIQTYKCSIKKKPLKNPKSDTSRSQNHKSCISCFLMHQLLDWHIRSDSLQMCKNPSWLEGKCCKENKFWRLKCVRKRNKNTLLLLQNHNKCWTLELAIICWQKLLRSRLYLWMDVSWRLGQKITKQFCSHYSQEINLYIRGICVLKNFWIILNSQLHIHMHKTLTVWKDQGWALETSTLVSRMGF